MLSIQFFLSFTWRLTIRSFCDGRPYLRIGQTPTVSPAKPLTAQEAFDRDNITLQAKPISSGKELANLVETTMMDLSSPAFELPRKADEMFAELVDYFRDYRDCHDMYSERAKFDVYDELDAHIDVLKRHSKSDLAPEKRIPC